MEGMLKYLIVVTISLFVTFQPASTANGKCYSRSAYSTCYYYQSAFTYYTRCGWWSRCSRTGYRQSYYYYTAYKSKPYCCSGYRQTSGWWSSRLTCSPICNSGCSYGRCISPNTCSCNSGWRGRTCSTPICNSGCGYGRCTRPNTCSCNSGWSGRTCSTPICNSGCGYGRCTSPYTCSCNSGWSGRTCSTPICNSGCGYGRCTYPNTCSCNSGWSGRTCSTPICNSGCGHGTCISPSTCSCNSGWKGSTCSEPICNSGCGHGTCISPSTCSCNSGWKGSTCSEPICNSGCGHGTCISPSTCSCNSGWKGSTCSEPICNPNCVHGTCTSPNTCSCNSGWKGSTCSEAICNPNCVYGTCTQPGTCSCQSGWTGSICRDDTYLTAWCSSIKNKSIDNDNLQFVRNDSLQVYCGSSSVDYEQNKTDYVAPKILADSQHDSQKSEYKAALYRLWELHPHVRDYCCKSNTNYQQELVDNIIKFDNTFYNYVGGLTKTSAMELRKELSKLCSTSLSDTFCYIYPALDLIDCAAHLPSSKSNWNSGTEIYRKAVLVNAFILNNDSRYSPYYSGITISESETDILINCTNEILKLMQNKETEKLEEFAKYLPPSDAYEATAATSCGTENLCIFMKIVEHVRLYLDSVKLVTNSTVTTVNGTRRLILNTATDYREFLREKQLDRILTVLSEQHSTSLQIANDLKKHSTTKFTELRSYFEKVATFNQKIADADIAFIHGRIDDYQNRLDKVVPKLKKDLDVIIKYAIIEAGLDVREKTVLLFLEIVATFNPLEKFFGEDSSLQDVLRAAADLVNAIAQVVKIAKVKSALDELAEKGRDIGEKLEKNDEFLGIVKSLIKKKSNKRESFKTSMNSFLTKYNDYNPQVTLPEISGLTSYWHSLIEAACDVIEETDGIAASVPKIILNNKGLCESTPALADEVTAIYEEIYEYQFDLIDAMAAYVRSSVALDAAKEINNEFEEVTKLNVDSGTTLTTLQMMGGLSYMTYTTYVLETVYLYCNVLEYMEGGRQPPECKGVDTDVALLIANIEPVCVSETYRYYYVPTSSSTENDKGYVDINKLMSGSLVHFQVPNATWLVDHEWIDEEEEDFAFYVKKFNVFLPAESDDHSTSLYVTTDPVLHNSIIPEATEYIIVPHTHMIQEYSIGRKSLPCGPQQKADNPYTSCRDTHTSQICQYSHMTNWLLYPSIYTQWSIRVKGGQDLIVPNPSTDMSVIFGIQLCKVPSGDSYRADLVRSQWTSGNDDCCPDGHYRPNVTSSCVECPAGSHSALAGYYCELDE